MALLAKSQRGLKMQLSLTDGQVAVDPTQQQMLLDAGYKKCETSQCPFFLSPATQAVVEEKGGYYMCPKCFRNHDLLQHMPWHGAPEEEGFFGYGEGGGTHVGLRMDEQGQIGERLIRSQGELPGYGPIVWWSDNYHSPLDGATKDWGIEVKTLGYDAVHHRFIPGRPHEKEAKNKQAEEMGLKGILGVLVILNYRTSLADVYVREMPLEPWSNGRGRTYRGVSSFRKNSGMHLLEEIPFQNPFVEPNNPIPVTSSPATADDPFAAEAVPF